MTASVPKKKAKKIRKKAPKKRTPKKEKPKPIGGFPFELKLSDRGLHWALVEANLGGHHKCKGTVDPEKAIDMYRAVLFFMWGIPLDKPIDKKTEKSIKAAIKKIEKAKKTKKLITQ